MINALLVEDEFILRENIKQSYIWSDYDYNLVGDASNGEDAKKFFDTYSIDILITDIRMPFMDGLELASYVKNNYPDTHIIIISGHSDFEYAQQAIQLGVTEYLVKPVTSQELLDILNKVKNKIEIHNENRKKLYMYDKFKKDFSDTKRKHLLNDLAFGLLSPEESIEASNFIFSENQQLYFKAIIVNLLSKNEIHINNFSKKSSEILNKINMDNSFSKGKSQLYILEKGSSLSQLNDKSNETIDHILKTKELSTVRPIIGIGRAVSNPYDISISFSDAMFLQQMAPCFDFSTIIDISELNPASLSKSLDLQEEKKLLSDLLYYKSIKSLDYNIAVIKSKIIDRKLKGPLLFHVSLILYKIIFDFCMENKIEIENFDLCNFFHINSNTASVSEISSFFVSMKQIIEKVLQKRDENRNIKHFTNIREIKEIIDANYMNSNLDLNFLANRISINQAYLSTIFKQETGTSFVEYLTNLRMSEAKKILLRPDTRISEVAAMVGINDANYFSKLFRKQFGISPSEYRNNIN